MPAACSTCQIVDCDAIGQGFDGHGSSRATTDRINSICKGCEEFAEMSFLHFRPFHDNYAAKCARKEIQTCLMIDCDTIEPGLMDMAYLGRQHIESTRFAKGVENLPK